MADKRLLYFTAQRITVYAWKASALTIEQTFASGDEGVSAFGVYVSENPDCLYYVLADLVEEDFAQESIPGDHTHRRSVCREPAQPARH